ncbi:unnamed protein product [Lepidochelys olivacea]
MTKKKRLLESLRGSGADFSRSLRVSNPEATAADYFSMLERVFGSTETRADVLLKFQTSQQEPGETFSACVLLIECLLQRGPHKKGVSGKELNCLRVEQILRGCQGSSPTLNSRVQMWGPA